MNDVQIKKEKLLKVLKKNLKEHRAIFLEAQEGYRKQAIALLDERLADARAGKRIDLHLLLIEPTDQSGDYNRAIKMLEMSEDKIIALSELDFECYVLDNWSWKRNFLVSNSGYSATAARLSGKR